MFNSIETTQPHPDLFHAEKYINDRPTYNGLNGIGNDMFHNNTRTQLRNQT